MAQAVTFAPDLRPSDAASAVERAPTAMRSRRALRRAGFHALVIVAFSLPAVALWWHAWDGHLSSTLTCACGDAGQTVWFIAWPAYALAHGLDPFFSGAVQAPYGANLLANASAIPFGIVLTPLTLAAGPVTSTNVALTLCPGLSAWACWISCRDLVGWRPAAVAAAALFGYSPFVVTNLALGHLGLALLVAPPLLLLASRRVLFAESVNRSVWGGVVGALCALQFFVSSEILAVTVVVGAPCTLVAAVVGRRALAPLRELAVAAGTAALVAVVLLTFPVWFFLAGPQHLHGPLWEGASVQGNAVDSLWNPGHYAGPAGTLLRFGGYEGHAGPPSSFVGPVVLVLAAASLLVAWRRRTALLVAFGAVVATAFSFGTVLWWTRGHLVEGWLPWRMFASWPLLEDVIPQRFSAVTDLCIVILVGIGIDAARGAVIRRRRRHPARWRAVVAVAAATCSAAALASLWWTYQVPFVTRDVSPPRWYAEAAPHLRAGTVVLSYPFPFPLDGSSGAMVWQAMDGMGFRLAGGYLKAPGRDGRPLSDRPLLPPYDVLAPLTARAAGALPSTDARAVAEVRDALARWGVDVVVVVAQGRDPALAVHLFTLAVGRPPAEQMGAWVWRLPAGRPGGYSPSRSGAG